MRGSQRTQNGDLGLLLGVFFAIALIYASLIAEVPVDDEAAFVARVTNQTMQFDLAYPMLLPFLRLAIGSFGSSLEPLLVLKLVNIVSAATGFAIFALTMRRSGLSVLASCCVVLFAALSFNFIALAPTGHPKMLSFPFLCGALHFAVVWERFNGLRPLQPLVASGLLLGLSSLFLVNGLAVIPFGVIAIYVIRRMQDHSTFGYAIKHVLIWSVLAVGTFFGGMLIAASLQDLDFQGVLYFLDSKNATGGVSENPIVMLARAGFAMVFGFVGLQSLGSTMRAIMAGYVSQSGPVIFSLLPSLFAFTLGGIFLCWVYFRSVFIVILQRAALPVVFPLAFVGGFIVFGVYWQLNETEFWYQTITPTCLIAAVLLKGRLNSKVLAFCLISIVIHNLFFFAIPRQIYPLSIYQQSATQKYGANDLVLYFSAYPGRPTFSFVAGPVKSKVSVDALFSKSKGMDDFLQDLRVSIDKSLATGGSVYAFEIFDRANWDAPWLELMNKDFDRVEFTSALNSAYCIRQLADEYRLPVWSIKSRSDCDY